MSLYYELFGRTVNFHKTNRLFKNEVKSIRGYRSKKYVGDKMYQKMAHGLRYNRTGKRMSVCNIQNLSTVKGVLTVRAKNPNC